MFATQKEEVVDQFTRQAAAYAALLRANPDRSLPPLVEAAAPSPSDILLDVGCGTGKVAVALASICARVVGVDLTPAMLDEARRLQREKGLSNVEWACGDVTRLPYADGSFSLVTSTSMLHHSADPAAVLAEMRRVCAPGGRIVVMDLTPPAERVAAFDAVEILRDASHVHAMAPEELRELGRGLGEEYVFRRSDIRLPLESVLAASFPPDGIIEKLRAIYRRDAESGADSLGMAARIEGDVVTVGYPLTYLAWRRA